MLFLTDTVLVDAVDIPCYTHGDARNLEGCEAEAPKNEMLPLNGS